MSEERLELEKLRPHEILPGDAASLQPRDYRLMGYKYPVAGYAEEERVHLRELWRTIRKRKWLIISMVLIVTSLMTVEMVRTKPTYQASTTVEIGKDNNTLVRSGDLIINDDSDPYYQVNVKTKMLLLNSRELHEDVVTDLKLDQNPKFLETDGGTSIWKALMSAFGKRSAEDEAADSDDMNEKLLADEPTRTPEESARLAPFVEALEENLTIEPVRDTRALKVSFIHTSPVIAAGVANGVARSFMQKNFQSKTEKFANTASWLDSSTRELKAKVEQSEQALANYTRENNIFSINDNKRESTTLTTEKLARLHDQAMRTETERMLKQTLYEELKAGRIAQLPEAFSDPKLMELQKQLNDLQIAAAQLGVRYAPKNPKMVEIHQQMVAVKAQIEASRKNLEDKLKIEFERALQDEQAFKTALGTIKDEAVQENQAAIQYNILKQDVDTARALYTDFLQKTNQAKAQVAEQQNNIRVIERASLPKKPVGPKRVLMILLAFMVSLGGSVGLVFFLDYVDNSIKSIDDVSRYVQLP
ncbi:MAG TPA: GumC family protein, partial [Blastocatellia bacterium]|nr:GumC family protein [Blastocatellia bacterium]